MNVEHALSLANIGNAILFLGSGFSTDARNIDGEKLPTAFELASELSSLAGVPGNFPLDRAAGFFIKKEGLNRLIPLLLRKLTPTAISQDMKTICALPWKRVYTTNYDLCFEQAVGTAWTPISISDGASAASRRVVHINGHLAELDIHNFDKNIKLSHSSYASGEFVNSPWSGQFRMDVGAASTLIFIGYSLADLDVARVLYSSPEIIQKTIFIVHPEASEIEIATLEDYGFVAAIGIKGIATIQRLSSFPDLGQNNEAHTFNWLAEYIRPTNPVKPTGAEVIKFLTLGDFQDSHLAASLSDPEIAHSVRRSAVDDAILDISRGQRWFAVKADLGNGKSSFRAQMAFLLSGQGYRVFYDTDNEFRREADIAALSKLHGPVALFLDESSEKLLAIEHLRAHALENLVVFVCVRSTLYDIASNRYEAALPSETVHVDLNRLDASEIEGFRRLLDVTGLWGERAALSTFEKDSFIKQRCKSEVASIILAIFRDTHVGKKLVETAVGIMNSKDDVSRFVAFTFLSANAVSRPSLATIGEVLNTNVYELIKSPRFQQCREIIYLTPSNQISFRSSIASEYLLKNAIRPENLLLHLAEFLRRIDRIKNNAGPKVNELWEQFQKFSFVEKLILSDRKRDLLVGYYDEIKLLYTLQRNAKFWLQYAITSMSFGDYTGAGLHFETAKSYAKDGQLGALRDIDNHTARFLLESRMNTDQHPDYFDAFKKADTIIFSQIAKSDTLHYPYLRATAYGQYLKIRGGLFRKDELEYFINSCTRIIDAGTSKNNEVSTHKVTQTCILVLNKAIEDAQSLKSSNALRA